MTIRVAVVGAAGRMGSTVCRAVQDAEGLELVARLDVGDALDAEHLAGADVAVDFTVPSVTEANVHALLDAGVDVVVGAAWTIAVAPPPSPLLGRAVQCLSRWSQRSERNPIDRASFQPRYTCCNGNGHRSSSLPG